MGLRQETRARYGIMGDSFTDCLTSAMCVAVALRADAGLELTRPLPQRAAAQPDSDQPGAQSRGASPVRRGRAKLPLVLIAGRSNPQHAAPQPYAHNGKY